MALIVKDRIKESTNTTGTGTLTLTGATTGFQTFAAVGDASTTYYAILNGNNWEVGLGTYTASGTTLSRDTVLSSSNAGAALNLSGGSDVFCTYPSEKAVFLNSSDVIEGTNIVVEGNIAANAVTTDKIINDAVTADKLADSINAEIAANTAKVTNATHTGDVTGATVLTIEDNAVNATKLNVTGDGTNTQFLQSDGDGSFTWNVPTDTTYTAGTGLGLTGTAFSLDLANDQTWTGSQRGYITVDADLSFDQNAGNNFSCTPAAGTLTLLIILQVNQVISLLDNSGGHAISAAATTKINATDLATISTAGVYLVSYFDNGTNAYLNSKCSLRIRD
jgi:hypothetical protein